jgi:hypothetical protein
MKRNRNRIDIVPCVIVACFLLGCGSDEPESQATAAEVEVPEITGGIDTVFTAAPARADLPSARIYYTLTDHEWYARGDPLMHENTAYSPSGQPVSVSLDEMQQAGDYFGVEYYVRPGDERHALYVPVFEGYWQPFRPDTTPRRTP